MIATGQWACSVSVPGPRCGCCCCGTLYTRVFIKVSPDRVAEGYTSSSIFRREYSPSFPLKRNFPPLRKKKKVAKGDSLGGGGQTGKHWSGNNTTQGSSYKYIRIYMYIYIYYAAKIYLSFLPPRLYSRQRNSHEENWTTSTATSEQKRNARKDEVTVS